MAEPAIARVLTVEDNPTIRADLRLLLEDAGFSVSDAHDGPEAVELAREDTPDVILLELALPDLDGVEVTRRIRREGDVPIVALADITRGTNLVNAAIEAGADSFVAKPLIDEEVVGAVFEVLLSHRHTLEEEARLESLAILGRILRLLGYPPEWASELESRQWRSGKLWREGAQ